MPNIKSAEKRMRSDAKKHARNRGTLSELKTLEKNMRTAEGLKVKEFGARLISRYDRAVGRGILKRGTADRKKSRIAHFLSKLSASKQ
jgi:small subunit ribosomal protein S20